MLASQCVTFLSPGTLVACAPGGSFCRAHLLRCRARLSGICRSMQASCCGMKTRRPTHFLVLGRPEDQQRSKPRSKVTRTMAVEKRFDCQASADLDAPVRQLRGQQLLDFDRRCSGHVSCPQTAPSWCIWCQQLSASSRGMLLPRCARACGARALRGPRDVSSAATRCKICVRIACVCEMWSPPLLLYTRPEGFDVHGATLELSPYALRLTYSYTLCHLYVYHLPVRSREYCSSTST